MVSAALPALRAMLPRVVAASLNVTAPVGVPLPGAAAATAAVKVTAEPTADGFLDEVKRVALASLFTVCTEGDEVLAVKSASPPYNATMVWLPGARDETVNVAVPPLSVAVPIGKNAQRGWPKQSLRVTVPVGVPDVGEVTVALNFTA
jgi:hypothetical protein